MKDTKQKITCGRCGESYEIDETTDLNLCPNCGKLAQDTIGEDLEGEG